MSDAKRDGNFVPSALGVSSVDGVTTLPFKVDPVTGRLLTDTAGGGSGTVTSVSVATANGFAGTVATATTTPVITITTSVNSPVLAGDGTAIAAATTTGTGSTVVLSSSPVLVTPTIGVATATSINGNFFTAGTYTLTGQAGKTLTFNGSITLTGTDAQTYTFPTTTATLARTDSGNTFTGASTASAWVLTSPTITTKISPTSDDGAPLGDTTHNFSDLFMASGAVINIANSNWVATHTSAILTVGTGDLRVTTAGTNTASVVTVGGTQTLTSKTFTAPALGAATATSINGLIITTTAGTLTVANSASASLITSGNFALTLTATNTTNSTLPAGTHTLAGLDVAQSFTAVQTIGNITFPDQGQLKLTTPTTDLKATGFTCGDYNSGYSSSAIGDLVYLDSSSTWQKCDANTLALYNGLLAIALEVKASGNALLVALPGSFVYSTTGFPTWTIGSPIYMSETAGAMTQTAPTTTDAATRVVGWGIHADKMYFFPSPDYITHT